MGTVVLPYRQILLLVKAQSFEGQVLKTNMKMRSKGNWLG